LSAHLKVPPQLFGVAHYEMKGPKGV